MWQVTESYEVNTTYACYYDSEDMADVVQDNEFNEKDVINALTWPMLFLAIGCWYEELRPFPSPFPWPFYHTAESALRDVLWL